MIPSTEVREGADIARLAADKLLATSNDLKGRAGSELRQACLDLKVRAEVYIVDNVIGPKLSNCFEQARVTGATLDEFNRIRREMLEAAANSLVAVTIKESCVSFSLREMSMVVVGMTFTSRDDVDRVRNEMVAAFRPAEESAADNMARAIYMALVTLHGAVAFHLYETARPLPQMLDFEFAAPRSTLVLSQRLYDTASRADELRRENKVVHPAFAPRQGRALSF